MKRANLFGAVVFLGLTTACMPSAESSLGFRLPDGDAEAGQQAFVSLQCNGCHQVQDVDIPFRGVEPAKPVVLGGDVIRVKTYGELVTAIINPSHKLAPNYPRELTTAGDESIMALAKLNDVMTVQQLVDLVAFLQQQYEVKAPDAYPYTYRYAIP